MKNIILPAVFLMLITIFAGTALASSLDFPTAVFQDQNFKLQQDSGAVDCDMPSGGGNRCLVAWTSPSGSDDGSFAENPNDPDPASADRWQKFTEVGTYTVTIEECIGGTGNCTGTPVDTNTVEVLEPSTIDGEISAGYYFETQTDWLQVMGYAQANAQSARAVWQGDDGTRIARCSAVNQGNNPEFSHGWENVSNTWPHQSYMLFINFFQGPGCTGPDSYPHYWVGDFDLLQIREIMDDLEDLTAALNGTNATLQAQIDDLYVQIGVMDANLTAVWVEIDDLWDTINAMNHGTINLYHNYEEGVVNELRVWGEAPNGALTAQVRACTTDVDPTTCRTDAGYIVDTVSVTSGGVNDNWYNSWNNISGWDPVKWNIYVTFEDGSGWMSDYNVGALFDDLYLFWLADWLNNTEQRVANNTAWLEDLNTTVGNHTARLDEIENDILAIQYELLLINGNITELHATDAWLQSQIDALVDRVDVLEDEVDALWDWVYASNHGTINHYHEYNPGEGINELRVWGEAPIGATTAYLSIFRFDQDPTTDTPVYTDSVNVLPPGAPPFLNTNSYWFMPFNGHQVDLWDFEPTKYNIIVQFDFGFGYMVGDTFDDLFLLYMDYNLWGDPEACMDIGYPLDILGEMPDEYREDTLWWLIEMVADEAPSDMTYGDLCDFAEMFLFYMSEGYIDPDEIVDMIPLEFSEYIHDVLRCIGYDDELHLNSLWNMCQQGDIDRLEKFVHGFAMQDLRVFETFMQTDTLYRGLSYGLNPKYGGFDGQVAYDIYLVQEWSNNPGGYDITQQLSECQWMQVDQLNTYNRWLELPPTWPAETQGEGRYRVHLEAHPCSGPEFHPVYYSNTFIIGLDDLADPWPTYGVSTVSVLPGEEQFAEGIFWTNDPIVEFSALMGNETDWKLNHECFVKAIRPNGDKWHYEYWSFDGDDPYMCSGDVDLSEIPEPTHHSVPVYDLEVCADTVTQGQVECGNIAFGWDTTPPEVLFIYPAEEDVLSGMTLFKAIIYDDGVIDEVNLQLELKENGTTWDFGLMNYSNASGMYELEINTTLIPNGWYNIHIYATDFATNVGYGFLDPIVDNIAPDILEVDMTGFVGSTMTVSAHLTDLPDEPNPLTNETPDGVREASAEIWGYWCDSWQDETCELDWCEYYTEDSYTICEEWDWTIEDCVLNYEDWCIDNWNASEENFTSYEECVDWNTVNECTYYNNSDCYDWCSTFESDTGYGSMEACMNGCFDTNCEWFETGEWVDCEDGAYVDTSCYDDCMAEYNDSVMCEENCTFYEGGLDACLEENSDWCYENWWDEGYESYQQCLEDECYSEECSWEAGYECSSEYTSECYDGYDLYDEDCIAYYEDYCLDNWEDDEFASYEDCVDYYKEDECNIGEDGIQDCLDYYAAWCPENWDGEGYMSLEACLEETAITCYNQHCDTFSDTYNLPTEMALTCGGNCFAEQECPEEFRDYDEFATDVVSLSLVSGTPLDGVWESSEVEGLVADKHYEVRVTATDHGNNTNDTGSSTTAGPASFFSMLGYTLTIAPSKSVVTDAESFTVSGAVSASDGSTPTGTVYVVPPFVNAPLLMGTYSTSVGPLPSGNARPITATYTPYAACPDVVYTAGTSVDVVFAGRGGGSGGGGGGSYGNTGDTEIFLDGGGDTEQIVEDTTPRESGGEGEDGDGGDTEQLTSGGDGEEGDDSGDSLITGEVTGERGFVAKNWPWLLVLGGLIILLLAIAKLAKRR